MQNLLNNMDFGNEAGDDVDIDELSSYFVEQETFRDFLNEKKKISIATARKGVGKSALLQWSAHRIGQKDPDALIIQCRGADLVRSNFKLDAPLNEPNDHINDWMIRICALVNRHLASTISFASSDAQITLIETAELQGYKSRNLVSCLSDRLAQFIGKNATNKISAENEHALLQRAKTGSNVWVMIDDLDATYQNTNAESLQLGTFFSACRYLMRDVKGINFRITLRTDVWPLIRRYDEASDKTEQYVKEILWSQDDFRNLLARRIESNLVRLGKELPKAPAHVQNRDAQENLLELIFEPKMDWAKKMIPTYKVLYTLSYERPRWAIQLCKLGQEAALRNRAVLIDKFHIDTVWGEYGAKRIADLVAEHKHQCPQVEELLNAFRGAPSQMPRDELLSWIKNRVLDHLVPIIEGVRANKSMEIARFLFRLGFILARSDALGGENYEHYRFDQMPDFFTSRTDADFGLKWEIHPCYREALDIKKIDRSHQDRFKRLRGYR